MNRSLNPYADISDADYARVLAAEYHPPQASSGNGTCVLIGEAGDLIGIQDSKLDPETRRARTQVFTRPEMAALIADAKAGRLDGLI